MNIKTELEALQQNDIYSLILFALYKVTGDPKQSALSQLCYILDKENLLKLCEYFGGLTLKIPTVEELETLVYALLVFQKVDIEHIPYDTVMSEIHMKSVNFSGVREAYTNIKSLLSDYNFNSGR